tara:strand:- start:418 stop:786 length:369 start_codon:yes stop_codon:yes gene_type:complete
MVQRFVDIVNITLRVMGNKIFATIVYKRKEIKMETKTLTEQQAKELIKRSYVDCDSLGITVIYDFKTIAHNDYEGEENIDFTNYGYLELVMLGELLTLFENRGYDIITSLINQVEQELYEEE